MGGCCNARGCDDFFGERFARRVADRYRKRGLDKASQRIVDAIADRGVAGATVLEVGGGVGEIQIELLRRGAESTTNLELSPAYDEQAALLLHEADLDGRVDRRLHDIAVDPAGVDPADVVVLHRVVCCYPDYDRLLTAAAGHARRMLVFSHPPRNVVSRGFIAAQNLGFRITRKDFRTFAHPPSAMIEVLERQGLRRTSTRRGMPWQVVALER